MQNSEERDFREGLVYDPAVKAMDTNFWKGDTLDVTMDTKDTTAIGIGDSDGPRSMSSFSQYLYGDFEFTWVFDSLSPDTSDSDKRWGLLNIGDTLERGAAYFQMSFDTVTGGDTGDTSPFAAVIVDEQGVIQSDSITWDTSWNNSVTRFRISWEPDGYTFLVNDTVVATLGDNNSNLSNSISQINTSIPQALRVSNRTTDTTSQQLKLVVVRNARKII